MLHQPAGLLVCLTIASVLAWYAISLWDLEFGVPSHSPRVWMEKTQVRKVHY